jgi:hypothetical protein
MGWVRWFDALRRDSVAGQPEQNPHEIGDQHGMSALPWRFGRSLTAL